MQVESENIIEVYNLYKTYISNRLSDILDDGKKINEKLVTKYADELELKTSKPTGHYWFSFGESLKKNKIKLVLVNPFHVKRSKELDDNHP